MARNSVLTALVHLESQKQLVLHPLLEQPTANNISPKHAVMPLTEQTQCHFLGPTRPQLPVQYDSWQSVLKSQELQFLIWQFYFQSYCVPSKWPFTCSSLAIHLSVRLKSCFYGQAALEQGWQILSQESSLVKQKEQFCALHCPSHPSITQNHRGEESNTITQLHLGPGDAAGLSFSIFSGSVLL